MYVFGLMFLAFGVCPDRWIAHSRRRARLGPTNIVYGPWDILKPNRSAAPGSRSRSRRQAVRDIVVVLIHVWFFGLLIYLWGRWQKRGEAVRRHRPWRPATTDARW